MSAFTTECDQNEYLPLGGSEVNAILTVTSDGAAGETSQREAAEIVIVDTSGSMGAPAHKLESAREATSVAIDCIRDEVAFGVIAGTDKARAVYPTDGTLAIASERSRSEAKRALRRLIAQGGTAIGSWLTLAGTLFATVPGRSATRSCSPTARTSTRRMRTSTGCWPSLMGGSSAIAAASAPTGA